MSQLNFDFLDDEDKLRYIREDCTLIAQRFYKNFSYELYQSPEFYIEQKVFVHEFISIQYVCFTDLDYLEPYLLNIDISDLLLIL